MALNCLKCEESTSKCSECPIGYILENNQCSRCTDINCFDCEMNDKTKCKPGSFFQAFNATCTACTKDKNCKACDPNDPSKCTECYDDKFPDDYHQCKPCVENCLHCKSKDECESGGCEDGFTELGGSCYECLPETFCKTCNSTDLETCTECKNGFYFS